MSILKTALFIDGANTFAAAKALNISMDYSMLKKFFNKQYPVLFRSLYYTAIPDNQDFISIRPLLDWLAYNGYQVRSKPTKEFTNSQGVRKVKGNMDIEIAVDAMELADHCDIMLLMSGDGDFRSIVEAVQRKGVHVKVFSCLNPGMVADELRRQADEFIDLIDIKDHISKPFVRE